MSDTPDPIEPPTDAFDDKDARLWAMLCHVSSFLMFTGIPCANVLGPLIVWLVKRDSSPLVADNGKEALNFNITVLIAAAVLFVLLCTGIGAIIAIPGLIALLVAQLVLTIIAAIKAYDGGVYRYPFILRLVS